MGPFPPSFGHTYILLSVDYVSKWVEVVATTTNDDQVVLKFLHKNMFTRFGTPRAIVSDKVTHFCNKLFNNILARYGVSHKVSLAYHPQTNGQVEIVKLIVEKIVNTNRKDWSKKLDDALWLIVQCSKHLLGCHLIDWCLASHAIYWLNWTTEHF